MGSGAPFQRVSGYVDDLSGPPFDPSGNVRPRVLGGAADRLPTYARVDVRAAFARTLGPARVEVQAGLQNALGRRNVVYFDPYTRARVDAARWVPLLALLVAVP